MWMARRSDQPCTSVPTSAWRNSTSLPIAGQKLSAAPETPTAKDHMPSIQPDWPVRSASHHATAIVADKATPVARQAMAIVMGPSRAGLQAASASRFRSEAHQGPKQTTQD